MPTADLEKGTKVCSGPCGLEKPLDNFPPNKKNKDGKEYSCIICARERAKLAQRKFRANMTIEEKLAVKEYRKLPRIIQMQKESGEKYNKKFKGKHNTYKQHAKVKNREFSLTLAEFTYILLQTCSYCGENNKPMGIDRIDNDKPYILSNSISCCETCNRAKLKMSKEEFLNWVTKLYYHNKEVQLKTKQKIFQHSLN